MAILIKCNHSVLPQEQEIQIKPENETNFTLKELYKHLRCDMIEVLYLNSSEIMIIDENGKLTNKPVNNSATRIFRENIKNTRDYICGHAIICHTSQLK